MKPPELSMAETYASIMDRWSYTLGELLAEDAHAMYQLVGLLDPDLGKAEGDE